MGPKKILFSFEETFVTFHHDQMTLHEENLYTLLFYVLTACMVHVSRGITTPDINGLVKDSAF